MGGKRTEACGRCGVTTVLDATRDGDDERGDDGGRDPFDGGRIELDADELRSVVRHEVLAGRLKSSLDRLAMRFIYR